MLPQLTQPTARQILAAEGWLDLGSPPEAHVELEEIADAERAHPLVLEIFWRVYGAWTKWRRAYEVADELVAAYPDLSAGWLHRAYAARRMQGGSLALALEFLQPAAELFPKEPLIPYNLACYSAQLGQLSEARELLEKALRLGNRKALRKLALADSDLDPLKAIGYLK